MRLLQRCRRLLDECDGGIAVPPVRAYRRNINALAGLDGVFVISSESVPYSKHTTR